VTEPAIYGVLLPLKRPFIACMVASGIASAFAGLTGVRSVAYASPSLLTLPIFLGDRFLYAVLTAALSFTLSFLLTWFFGFEDQVLKESDK
jgi:beta-glucoside PTS system EIICBA component